MFPNTFATRESELLVTQIRNLQAESIVLLKELKAHTEKVPDLNNIGNEFGMVEITSYYASGSRLLKQIAEKKERIGTISGILEYLNTIDNKYSISDFVEELKQEGHLAAYVQVENNIVSQGTTEIARNIEGIEKNVKTEEKETSAKPNWVSVTKHGKVQTGGNEFAKTSNKNK